MRLIDVLDMIADGELEEGTKVKIVKFDMVYEYKNCSLWSNVHATEIKVAINTKNLNAEVELIEPKRASKPTFIKAVEAIRKQYKKVGWKL